ncbi:MAG: hypothetical protein ACREQA_18345 [Candidatus Binatia bacterium]
MRPLYTIWFILVGALLLVPRLAQTQPEQSNNPCIDGPEALRQIDKWERVGIGARVKDYQSGLRITPEEAAELFIASCSDIVSRLSAVATLMTDKMGVALVSLFQGNLEYMKWWLQNRRQKGGR